MPILGKLSKDWLKIKKFFLKIDIISADSSSVINSQGKLAQPKHLGNSSSEDAGVYMSRNERCILCGQMVPYDISIPITQRRFYMEGAGQLCGKCFLDICK